VTTLFKAILKNKNGMFDCKSFSLGSTLEDVKEWARGRGGTYSLFVTEDARDTVGFDVDDYPEIYRIKDDKMTYHGFAREAAK
jgi:hypothetical protein